MRNACESIRSTMTCTIALLSAGAGLGLAAPPAAAAERLPVAAFRSVVLHGGGEVILRHGATQSVSLLEGSTRYTSATIEDRDVLRIERCAAGCPRGYKPVVEVVTPAIGEISVMGGGTIRTLGGFPSQPELHASVENGGTLDLRALRADDVFASVHDGGRILARPRSTLAASIAQGGVVTYWGEPEVRSSIRAGGAVTSGRAADLDRPLSEIADRLGVVPPVPPVPPRPARPTRTIH